MKQAALTWIFLFVIWLLICLPSLLGVVPLTYDEAWNYLNISSRPALWVMTNYPYANNHILFSTLQSLALPGAVIEYWPPLLRILNLSVVGVVIFGLGLLLRKITESAALRLLLVAGLLLASPLLTLYLFVARGYLLANLLSVLAVVACSKKRYLWSAVALGLATYSVPTYGFAFPGLLFARVLTWRRSEGSVAGLIKDGFLLCGAFLFITLTGYFPVRAEMAERAVQFTAFATAADFFSAFLRSLTAAGLTAANGVILGVLFLGVLLLGNVYFFARRANFANPGSDFFITASVTAVSLSLSTLSVSILGSETGLMNLPFLRSAQSSVLMLHFSYLCLFALIRLEPGLFGKQMQRGLLALIGTLLFINAVAGAALLRTAFLKHGPESYPYFAELNPSPIESSMRSGAKLGGSMVSGAQAIQPLLEIYRRAFQYELEVSEATLDDAACSFGVTPPRAELRVRSAGQALCF